LDQTNRRRMRRGGAGRRLWLWHRAHCRRTVEIRRQTFFVSNLPEARSVRARAPEATIYVLNGFYSGTGPAFADINARPVINSAMELADGRRRMRWSAMAHASSTARRRKKRLPHRLRANRRYSSSPRVRGELRLRVAIGVRGHVRESERSGQPP